MTLLADPSSTTSTAAAFPSERRSVSRLLEPLNRLTDQSGRLVGVSHGRFERGGESCALPRYLYLGRKGGGDRFRIGIFATIHGDEPEGTLALAPLLRSLDDRPEIAEGYALFLYPVCNPTGFEDNIRLARGGADLNREFWKQSDQPEVRFLESEIWMQAFDGIIMLHSDESSDGLYGFVKGAVLSEHLLAPALREASRHLPTNQGSQIDGFAARRGIIHDGYPGMLQSIPGTSHPPFEITLETPQRAPLYRQVNALVVALQTILLEYRYLQAVAQNI